MGQKICNVCGKVIAEKEDCLLVNKVWGYFSEKDTMRHSFHVCENCYDAWISTFAVPVAVTEETEIL